MSLSVEKCDNSITHVHFGVDEEWENSCISHALYKARKRDFLCFLLKHTVVFALSRWCFPGSWNYCEQFLQSQPSANPVLTFSSYKNKLIPAVFCIVAAVEELENLYLLKKKVKLKWQKDSDLLKKISRYCLFLHMNSLSKFWSIWDYIGLGVWLEAWSSLKQSGG